VRLARLFQRVDGRLEQLGRLLGPGLIGEAVQRVLV